MRLSLLIALSHLRARKSEVGISAITAISILGVVVGVTALIMVLAVMEGFEIDLRDKILGSNAHIVVLQYGGNFSDYEKAVDTVQKADGVVAAAPFVYSEVMIRSPFAASGVIIKGIDLERTPKVTDVSANIQAGPNGAPASLDDKDAILRSLGAPIPPLARRSFDAPADPPADGTTATVDTPPRMTIGDPSTMPLPGIIIGNELASQLNVFVGDTVTLINPIGGSIGPMGIPTPRVRPFRIAGVFKSGMYEYDTKWTYVSIAEAQSFLETGDLVTGIEARVADIDDVDGISEQLGAELAYPFFVKHWKNLNQSLFSALKLEKIVMGLILSLIVMVASLNIIGTLILVVLTRAREISILRAMGTAKGTIRGLFMIEGLIIGVVGTTIGTILGLLGCMALKQYRYPLDTDVYYLDSLPVVVEPNTVVSVVVAAVLISFLATVYPATLAARIDPVEGLRYE
jgi:lipoprotein-releasing system permease protein